MDLLVIGGTGVISYAVVCEAVRQGIHVTCINRGISKKQQLPDSVEQIHVDYRDHDAMTRVLSGRMFDAALDVLCYKKEDIRYSVSILKDVCRQYFFFSSCAVYNKGKGDYECTEDSELINPVWDYSINKVECEKELLSLAHSEGFIYTIVRPAVTYGNTRIPYGITPPYGYHGTLIQRILHHKPIIVWDNGEAYSTITHVDDFAVGFVGLIGNPKAFNQAFHVVGDCHYHWKDVLLTLGEILGVEPVLFNLTKEQYANEIPSRKGELLGGRGISQLLDNSKIKDAVPAFKTNISLYEGIKRTVEYYQSHNYLMGIDWKFDGDTDRIIRKWCKKYNIDDAKYKLEFVDYFGTASYNDKKTYWLEYHKDIFLIKLLICCTQQYRRIVSFAKSILQKGKRLSRHYLHKVISCGKGK